jgi:UDP-glucose 4-epimerase
VRILITGGFGYLGGRLAQALEGKAGNEIRLGSRSKREPPEWLSNAEPVRTQWDSADALGEICSGVDSVVHLAGMNAQQCAADPSTTVMFRRVATSRLLEAAARQGVRRFIYVSTAQVYASPLVGKITEDTQPTSAHAYAVSHRAGEDAVRGATGAGRMGRIVLRLSNALGAPASPDADCWTLLTNDLCRQAVSTGRMVLRSSGLQHRDFVPLAGVCDAIAHVLQLPAPGNGAEVFNLGGEWAPTVWEIASLVRKRCLELLRFEPTLIRRSPKAGEAPRALDYRIDALRRTGYESSRDSVQEIDQLLEFCDESFGRRYT